MSRVVALLACLPSVAHAHGNIINPTPRHILQMPAEYKSNLGDSTLPGYPMAWNRQMWQPSVGRVDAATIPSKQKPGQAKYGWEYLPQKPVYDDGTATSTHLAPVCGVSGWSPGAVCADEETCNGIKCKHFNYPGMARMDGYNLCTQNHWMLSEQGQDVPGVKNTWATKGPPQATITAGATLNVTYSVVVNHAGFYRYFLSSGDPADNCTNAAWDCFRGTPLDFVSRRRSYSACTGHPACSDVTLNPHHDGWNYFDSSLGGRDGQAHPTIASFGTSFKTDLVDEVRIPADAPCAGSVDGCVILARWDSIDGGIFTGCTDVAIVASPGPGPRPPLSPTPVPAPTPAPASGGSGGSGGRLALMGSLVGALVLLGAGVRQRRQRQAKANLGEPLVAHPLHLPPAAAVPWASAVPGASQALLPPPVVGAV
jgi:hypothetical protein